MPRFIRKQKLTYENYGNQTTRNNTVRHKTRCSAEILYCNQCPKFNTTSQDDLKFHLAKKHSAPKLVITFMCKFCHKEFPGFYALRQHKNIQHGFLLKTKSVDPVDIIHEVDDMNLKEELR